MPILESAGLTDVGKKRRRNEDSLFFDDQLSLYVVADGMGGHQAGEVASRLVVESVRDYMKRFHGAEQGGNDVEELEDSDTSLSKEANRLVSSVLLANRVVNLFSASRDSYEGMGSTVSLAHFTDSNIIVANVGDSPIYLFRGKEARQLSTTHTVEAEQAALDPEGISRLAGMFSHMLTRAVGTKDDVLVDVKELPMLKDDVLVLCSDGLSNHISKEEIHGVVLQERPQKACQILTNLALARGGDDNITLVVVKVKKPGPDTAITRLAKFVSRK